MTVSKREWDSCWPTRKNPIWADRREEKAGESALFEVQRQETAERASRTQEAGWRGIREAEMTPSHEEMRVLVFLWGERHGRCAWMS